MRSLLCRLVVPFAFLIATAIPISAFAQPEASPEPGDKPPVGKVPIVVGTETPGAEAKPPAGATTESQKISKVTPLAERRIEQRVDNTSTNEAIRIAPKPKKNVSRIDNKPNRPQVKPIAVIKGPVSPWGYADRYLAGEIQRPSAKELQGNKQQPGAPGATPGQAGSLQRMGGSGSARASRKAE